MRWRTKTRRPGVEADRERLLQQAARDYGNGKMTRADYERQTERIKSMQTHAELQTQLKKAQLGFEAVDAASSVFGTGMDIAERISVASEGSGVAAAEAAVSGGEGASSGVEGLLSCCELC